MRRLVYYTPALVECMKHFSAGVQILMRIFTPPLNYVYSAAKIIKGALLLENVKAEFPLFPQYISHFFGRFFIVPVSEADNRDENPRREWASSCDAVGRWPS